MDCILLSYPVFVEDITWMQYLGYCIICMNTIHATVASVAHTVYAIYNSHATILWIIIMTYSSMKSSHWQ